MMTAKQIQAFVQERKHRQIFLQKQLEDYISNRDQYSVKYNDLVETRRIISEAARTTQLQFKGFVENLVTMAIQTVFPEQQYAFVMEFDLKSNRSEINLLVQQGDKEAYRPEEEQGGGLLDILSFALRVVMWSLEKPHRRAVFIMDEPFRYCGKLTVLAGNMMKEISERLGIQIIMVTHEDSLRDVADKLWLVKREKGGWSNIELQGTSGQLTPQIATAISKPKLKRRK